MRPPRLAALAMPVAVLAASQAGHLLALELRQGPRAGAPAGPGVHAYVPALATLALGAGGALVLAALLVMAWARVTWAGRGRLPRPARRGRVLDLAAALFALQLAIFVVQETLEAAAGHRPLLGAADLMLWGSAGQLPVALAAALVLSWLGARFEAALVDLADAAGRALTARPAEPAVRLWLPTRRPLVVATASHPVSERGPPPPPWSQPIRR